MTDDDERISGIKRGDLVKYKDSYYVYNAGDGPEGTWAPNPNTGSNVLLICTHLIQSGL